MISIITPVFQCEKYLTDLIDSILQQTYTDWELLLVDDGSRDRSPMICDRYAARDARIRVIHQENRGPAAARNAALAVARGEYIAFADSDDWMERGMLERMSRDIAATKADLVVYDYYEEYPHHTLKMGRCDGTSETFDHDEALMLTFEDRLKCYLWRMVVSRSIVREPFSDYRAYEDYATLFKWMSHARAVVWCHVPLYHYRQSATSTLHSHATDNTVDLLRATAERHQFVVENGLLPHHRQRVAETYACAMLKVAKDIVRSGKQKDFKLRCLRDISKELRENPPSSTFGLGMKRYIRYKLLSKSPQFFTMVVAHTRYFSRCHAGQRSRLFG